MSPEEQDLLLVRFCNLLQKFDNIHKMAESKEIQKFYKRYPEMLEMFNYEYGKKCRFLELGEICSKKRRQPFKRGAFIVFLEYGCRA